MPITLMVATHANLIQCKLDDGWNLVGSEAIAKGYHYGLSTQTYNNASSDGNCLALHGGPNVHDQSINNLNEYRCTSDSIELLESIPAGENVGAIHQVLRTELGIFVVNTAKNSIVLIYDNIQRSEHIINGKKEDVNHVNSIIRVSDYIVVLLHNRLSKESEIQVLTHSPEMMFVSRHSLWDAQCHNIFIDEQHLYYNASSDKSFVKADWMSGNIISRLSTKQHTKGLSVTDNHFIIGASDYAARNQRAISSGNLLVIDRISFEITATVPLCIHGQKKPKEIGNINEIRALNDLEQGEQVYVIEKFPESLRLAPSSPNLMLRRAYWRLKLLRSKLKSK